MVAGDVIANGLSIDLSFGLGRQIEAAGVYGGESFEMHAVNGGGCVFGRDHRNIEHTGLGVGENGLSVEEQDGNLLERGDGAIVFLIGLDDDLLALVPLDKLERA